MKKIIVISIISFLWTGCVTQKPNTIFTNKALVGVDGQIASDNIIKHLIVYPSEAISYQSNSSSTKFADNNGIFIQKNSRNSKIKIVPANTPGSILSIKRDTYGISEIKASFDLNDPDCTFSFQREGNGAFKIVIVKDIPGSESESNDQYNSDAVLYFQKKIEATGKNQKQKAKGDRSGARKNE